MIDQTLKNMSIDETRLYIKIVDGQPVDHPVLELNLIHVYGSVDAIPSEYQPFTRTIYDISPSHYVTPVCSYQQINGVWQDVWEFVDIDEDEKAQVKQLLIDRANSTVDRFKELSQTMLSDPTLTPTQLSAWQQFSQDINAWTLVDEENPNIPTPPPKSLA